MSVSQHDAALNGLLASLEPAALGRLLHKLVPVTLPRRQVLYRADGPIDAVYFVTSGLISLVLNLRNGGQAEVGILGREGMLGMSLVAGVGTSFVEAMVQIPGSALRMGAAEFRQELEAIAPLQQLVLLHAEALQAQIMQTAACNGHHSLEQRLARWLLMVSDRQGGDDLTLTQEFIAMMLGVHRPSVTSAASIFQRAGMIHYGAGRIRILDRALLEAAACECYDAVRQRFAMLLGTSP